MEDKIIEDKMLDLDEFERVKQIFEEQAAKSGIGITWSEKKPVSPPNTIVADYTGFLLVTLGLLVPGAALAGIAVRVFLALSGL